MSIVIDKSHPCHTDIYQKKERKPTHIVIHFVGTASVPAKNFAICNQYNNAKRDASWHFCVGDSTEGYKIYQSVDPRYIAWHCGDSGVGTKKGIVTNANSIGIEHCFYYSGNNAVFERGTYNASVELVHNLMEEYNIPLSNVVRHYDVTRKSCPLPFLYDDGQWEGYLNAIKNFNALVKETILVNGVAVTVYSTTIDGVTFVPLRKLAEMLGTTITWQGKDKPILVNGAEIECETKLIDIDGGVLTTFVPMRAIAVMCGATVSYDATTKQKSITK